MITNRMGVLLDPERHGLQKVDEVFGQVRPYKGRSGIVVTGEPVLQGERLLIFRYREGATLHLEDPEEGVQVEVSL